MLGQHLDPYINIEWLDNPYFNPHISRLENCEDSNPARRFKSTCLKYVDATFCHFTLFLHKTCSKLRQTALSDLSEFIHPRSVQFFLTNRRRSPLSTQVLTCILWLSSLSSPCLCRRGWINSAYLLPEEGMATPESTGTRDSHLQLPAPEKHLPKFKLVKFRELLLGKKKKCCILTSQFFGRILCGWIAGGSKFIRCVKCFSLSLVIISDK